MRYLLLNGSPHKGNTWKIAMEVKESILRIQPDALFEEIHLLGLNLPFCIGCSNCFRLGSENCPHEQKMRTIIDAIERADGVIVVSTTYFMNETSLLKNVFDHLCFMVHRPYFFKSKALIITSTGGVGARFAAKKISSFLKSIGFNKCYLLPAATSSWNAFEPDEKMIRKYSSVAGKFHGDVNSRKMHSPSAGELIPYNLFRGMFLYNTADSKYPTQDGVHWTDPVRAKSAYDISVPVPIYKKIFGNLFYRIGKSMGRKIEVSYRK